MVIALKGGDRHFMHWNSLNSIIPRAHQGEDLHPITAITAQNPKKRTGKPELSCILYNGQWGKG